MKCILLFLFLIFLNLIKFLLLMNLHVCSSFSTWMIFHGISYLLCLLMNQYSLTTWWKFLHSFLSLLFFEVFPNLMAFFFHTVWCFFKILFLLDGFPSYLAWWSELSFFLDELSFLNLMTSSSFSSFELVSLSSLKIIRSTLPHLEI